MRDQAADLAGVRRLGDPAPPPPAQEEVLEGRADAALPPPPSPTWEEEQAEEELEPAPPPDDVLTPPSAAQAVGPLGISREERAALMREYAARKTAARKANAEAAKEAKRRRLAALPGGTDLRAQELRAANKLVLPAWLGDIASSHSLFWAGGVAACSACAGMCATDPSASRLLNRPCRRTVADGSRARLARVYRRGLLPTPWTTWPDERADPEDCRAVFPLRWDARASAWTLDVLPLPAG